MADTATRIDSLVQHQPTHRVEAGAIKTTPCIGCSWDRKTCDAPKIELKNDETEAPIEKEGQEAAA